MRSSADAIRHFYDGKSEGIKEGWVFGFLFGCFVSACVLFVIVSSR